MSTFNSRAAFDAIITLGDQIGYIKKAHLRLDVLYQEFSVLINKELQEGVWSGGAAMETICLLFPALDVACDGRTMHNDFDLSVDSILEKNGYPVEGVEQDDQDEEEDEGE